jgi:xylulokinase
MLSPIPRPQFLDALDLLLGRMRAASFPFHRVAAVSGSGQQHGSAYWKTGARASLQGLKAGAGPLKKQLAGAFSVADSPIWMDSSTSAQCAALGA